MKKIISCLLVFATVMCNTACTKSETNSDINSDTTIEIQAEMLSLKSADILMAADFSEIICIDKNGTNNLIFGKLKSGKYSGYIANDEFTENKTFYFNPQEDEIVKNAALALYGKSAVLTTLYNDTYIYIFGNNGELEKTLELGEVISPDDKYIELLCTEEGFYVNIDRRTLAYIDSGGNYKGDVNTKGSNICGIVKDSNNVPCVLMSDDSKMTLAILTECKISEETNCDELADYTNAICTGKGDYRIVVIVDEGLYGLKNDKWIKLTNFSENDFLTYMIKDIDMIDNDAFAITLMNGGNENEMRLLSKRDISEIKAKKNITLANVVGGSDPYNNLIKKYNSESENYKVEVVNYATSSSPEEAANNLRLDIISGKAPDIISFEDTSPVESYGAEDSVFVDMNILMDNDSDINRDDFLDGFLESMETNGKLLQLTSTFGVKTMMIKDKFANGLTSWNIDELEAIFKNKPEDMIFSVSSTTMPQVNMLGELIDYTQFYDRSTAECYFNSPDFIKAMRFINDNNIGLSDIELNNNIENMTLMDSRSSFRNDKVLVQEMSLFSFTNLRQYQQEYANESSTFIGFPTKDKPNALCDIPRTYGIMANSKNIDGAWDFLKYYLLSEDSFNDDFNHNMFSGIEKYYNVQFEDFCKSNSDADTFSYFDIETDEEISIKSREFTKEEMKGYDNFIRSSLKYPADNIYDIQYIVWEEAGAYFAGERSAEEAAEIIQNRVSIYLSEQT